MNETTTDDLAGITVCLTIIYVPVTYIRLVFEGEELTESYTR